MRDICLSAHEGGKRPTTGVLKEPALRSDSLEQEGAACRRGQHGVNGAAPVWSENVAHRKGGDMASRLNSLLDLKPNCLAEG
jgi:hypothetical protein